MRHVTFKRSTSPIDFDDRKFYMKENNDVVIVLGQFLFDFWLQKGVITPDEVELPELQEEDKPSEPVILKPPTI